MSTNAHTIFRLSARIPAQTPNAWGGAQDQSCSRLCSQKARYPFPIPLPPAPPPPVSFCLPSVSSRQSGASTLGAMASSRVFAAVDRVGRSLLGLGDHGVSPKEWRCSWRRPGCRGEQRRACWRRRAASGAVRTGCSGCSGSRRHRVNSRGSW